MAARYPEFVYGPDEATTAGYMALFGRLFQEPGWLGEHLGMEAGNVRRLTQTLALLATYDLRRCCAILSSSAGSYNAAGARSESTRLSRAASLTEATFTRWSPAECLLEPDEEFRAATHLRAHLFAAGLEEHLRMRHGRRWWAKRAARDELIDLWNTCSRYKVEELARLIGFGPLSIDLLIETMNEAMSGGEKD